jgi:hypothetical protein
MKEYFLKHWEYQKVSFNTFAHHYFNKLFAINYEIQSLHTLILSIILILDSEMSLSCVTYIFKAIFCGKGHDFKTLV